MTRAKKQSGDLGIEEKLAQVLIAKDEHPYELPENWCWTKVKFINQYTGNNINPMDQENDVFELYSVPSYIDRYPEILLGKDIGSSKQSVKKDDVLVCKINPRINRVWGVGQFTDNELVASSEWIVVRNKVLNSKYLMFWFQSQVFRKYMLSNVSGVGGSLMRAQPKFVKEYPVPISPLSEQQRIVERIESLFSKLDEAKEKLQEILDGFEVRKAAILHKAFNGELTAKWREEQRVSLESWEHTNLGKYATSQYGFTESATNEVVGPKFLRITDIQNGKVNWEKVPYCKIDEESKDKYKLNIGDIVVARTGATTGKCYLIIDDVDSVFASFLIRVSVDKSKIDTYYLYWFMQSQQYWFQITELSAGIAQPGVNGRKLVGLNIPIPTIEEQIAIVNLLNNEFAKEAYVKTKVESVFKEIDSIKKSILVRAFRGELGTNDPNEESAIELLKTIL